MKIKSIKIIIYEDRKNQRILKTSNVYRVKRKKAEKNCSAAQMGKYVQVKNLQIFYRIVVAPQQEVGT